MRHLNYTLREFDAGNADLKTSVDSFDRFSTTVSADIIEFCADCLSEKYGNPETYSALHELVERAPSEEEIRQLMNKFL